VAALSIILSQFVGFHASGNYPAKVDEKGRLKIPSAFLETLKEHGEPVLRHQ